MSKKIYNTLKIEGESLCLELVKDNVTKVFENHYEINLKPLFKGKCGIINYELIGNKPTNSAEMPSLKDSFEDFEFEYKNKSTFYEWCSFVKFTDTSVWVEKKWSKLILIENTLLVDFTSEMTPPIIEIMLGSNLYPALRFTLSFFEDSDTSNHFKIEGANGKFQQIK